MRKLNNKSILFLGKKNDKHCLEQSILHVQKKICTKSYGTYNACMYEFVFGVMVPLHEWTFAD